MKPKNVDAARPRITKKMPPGRKPAVKTAAPEPAPESATPKTPEAKHESASKAELEKNNETTPEPITATDSKPEQAKVEEDKASDAISVTPDAKVVPRTRKVVKKIVRRVVKKTPGKMKTPATVEVPAEKTLETENALKSEAKVEGSINAEVEDVKKFDSAEREELVAGNGVECMQEAETAPKIEELLEGNVAETGKELKNVIDLEAPVVEHAEENSQFTGQMVGDSVNKTSMAVEVDAPYNEVEKNGVEEVDDKEDPANKGVNVEENVKGVVQREDARNELDMYGGDEVYEEYGDQVDFEDHGEDDYVEEDSEEPIEEVTALEDERIELTAVAKERKIKKEYEIFVGGLDRDAKEEDVRKVFETIGEVVEVRLHRNFSTNRNKGYAFVKFSNKEHAKRALSEMKNPTICGKRCGTAPSEDNDTLFLGNICNTWTKEAIRQKLKDYGVEGVENIIVVPDAQHEGRSRGFAFLEFSCHTDALLAYKRLQKPDAIFGHQERTAKVAFAEPIREPDPEVMAQVKTVFLDGLPPHWDEDRVRECIKGYGEVVRIVLARNMSTAKRKDFGFADFSTHEAAVACIEGLNNVEMADGNSKVRVKARLSNPLPKTQPVKGGMCGGFRIGHASSRAFSRFGRGFGRGGHHLNWPNFTRGRGFNQRGRGITSRMGSNEQGYTNRHAITHGRQTIGRGGRRAPLRGGYHSAGRAIAPPGSSRANLSRPWLEAPERGHGNYVASRRQPFPPEEAFDRPFVGRHFEDPYFYDDGAHGMKRPRPFYMTDHEPDYVEPSRLRPRLDYLEPEASFRGTSYHDPYGPRSDPHPHDYYGQNYGPYSSSYGSHHSYGRGYYY